MPSLMKLPPWARQVFCNTALMTKCVKCLVLGNPVKVLLYNVDDWTKEVIDLLAWLTQTGVNFRLYLP